MFKNASNKKIISALFVLSTFTCTALFASFAPSTAQIYQAGRDALGLQPDSYFIKASVGGALSSGKIGDARLSNKNALKAFYEGRMHEPFWSDSNARRLLEALEDSWTHGLNPQTYHVSTIRSLMNRGHDARGDVELLLTDGFLRYARDMSGMRVNAGDLKLRPNDWRQPYTAEYVFNLMNERSNIAPVLASLEPKGRTYQALRAELIRLSQEKPQAYEQYLPIQISGLVRPGQGHKEIPKLRARLGLVQPERNRGHYDDYLAGALMQFQKENGLEADGVIGSRTLQLLNRTKTDRMLQLVANMERLRWVEEQKPERFIVVNIPSATLWALDNGKVKVEMPVIVGSPQRQTQSFVTEIAGVRFNPDWTVPPTIKAYDILPKVQEDPAYLLDKGIELIKGYGDNAVTLDPMAMDWHTISRAELNGIRFVQTPGAHNPLGRIRILMPNEYNIYLHDTNHPELFERSERQVSSGCMRMFEPEKVADFVMSREKNWSKSEIQRYLDSGKKTDVSITQKIPVYVLYYTAWVDDRGKVVYGSDVYNQDTKLIDQLARLDGIALPRQNGDSSADKAALPELAAAH